MKNYKVIYRHRLDSANGWTKEERKVKANSKAEAAEKAIEQLRKSLGQPNRIVEILSVEEI
ncbi:MULTISPECIES: hypothetical protein [Glaesserella]|uniref:Uncharacterized protein n=1 Tax=Glaesserella australis TaxID=2094024 RepID=A0A328BZE4_9PAST|nr:MULTISPECIES: hypothetical protein [Glaesserella]AUI65190.1 hypothetical protein CJD39_00750 [Glaesserella sp. 15-184]RAL18462.1 hypothetical protein C5N92_07040 [Glaesserella australis]